MKQLIRSGAVQKLAIHIRSSLWFVPTLVILAAVALAVALVELDRHFDGQLREWWPQLFAIEAEGARAILSAIAGSMATVAGVVFSITVVALALAASQYTSRVLRNFMRDPVNQVMLGIFIGVYLYCLLVLRTISGDNGAFVPSMAVLGALLLAVFASGFFIFFIHHISSTIQASEIIAAITRETLKTIDLLFPENAIEAVEERVEAVAAWQQVPAATMGYIESVDYDTLLACARRYDLTLRMECSIGEFVAPGRTIATVSGSGPLPERLCDDINKAYAIGSYRTVDQDPAFGLRQLVDISLKALSPGINDTTTAVTCIEHLAVVLGHCAARDMDPSCRYEGRNLRLVIRRPDFASLTSLAFDQILENAKGNTEILLRLLIAVRQVGAVACNRARLEVLSRQVDNIEEMAKGGPRPSHSMRRIESALRQTRSVLAEGACVPTLQPSLAPTQPDSVTNAAMYGGPGR